jgi:hypothetical protein
MSGEPGVSNAANPDAALDTVFETPAEPAEESREAPAAASGKPETTTPDAKPRDEKGRFVTPSSPEDPQAEATKPATEPAEPGTDAEPADATTDDDLTDLPEFVYRAVGQEQTFPGSFVSKDGEVLFTKDALPVLKQKLALADSFPGYRAQMQRDTAAATNRAQAAEAMTEQIFAKMEELAANPDAAWDWWSNAVYPHAGGRGAVAADAGAGRGHDPAMGPGSGTGSGWPRSGDPPAEQSGMAGSAVPACTGG